MSSGAGVVVTVVEAVAPAPVATVAVAAPAATPVATLEVAPAPVGENAVVFVLVAILIDVDGSVFTPEAEGGVRAAVDGGAIFEYCILKVRDFLPVCAASIYSSMILTSTG